MFAFGVRVTVRAWAALALAAVSSAACGDLPVKPLSLPDAGDSRECDQPPMALCGGACVNTLSNADHCGKCDAPCAPPGECGGGVCQTQE